MPFEAKVERPAEETALWPSQERDGQQEEQSHFFHFWVVPLRTA